MVWHAKVQGSGSRPSVWHAKNRFSLRFRFKVQGPGPGCGMQAGLGGRACRPHQQPCWGIFVMKSTCLPNKFVGTVLPNS